jgi:hypothetical protein
VVQQPQHSIVIPVEQPTITNKIGQPPIQIEPLESSIISEQQVYKGAAAQQQPTVSTVQEGDTTVNAETSISTLITEQLLTGSKESSNRSVDDAITENIQGRYPKRSNRTTYEETSLKRHTEGFSCFDISADIALNLTVKESLKEEPKDAQRAIIAEFR